MSRIESARARRGRWFRQAVVVAPLLRVMRGLFALVNVQAPWCSIEEPANIRLPTEIFGFIARFATGCKVARRRR